MDLVQAISAIGALKDNFAYHEITEARKTLQEFEVALGNLILTYEKLGIQDDNLVQLIANFEKIKEEILEYFDE